MPCHISVPVLILCSHCDVPHKHLPILCPNNTAWLSSVAPVDTAVCWVHCPLICSLCVVTFVILFTGVCTNIMWHSAKCRCRSHAFFMLCNLCSWCSIMSIDLLQIFRIFTPISTTNCPFVADKLLPHIGNCVCTSTYDIKCWGEM